MPRGATVGDATFARRRSPSSKAFGYEQGSGRAAKNTTKVKKNVSEGLGTKTAKRRPESPEAVRRGAKRRVTKVQADSSCGAAKTLGREETRSEAAPLSEFCTGCTAVIPLSCVEYCIITFMLREYSEMLAVGRQKQNFVQGVVEFLGYNYPL